MKYSIKNTDRFSIKDQLSQKIYYGSNQEWYKKRWQRMAGCGPSAVANVIHYVNWSGLKDEEKKSVTRESYLSLMSEVWDYVTPSFGGISSTNMLCGGVDRYVKEKKLNITTESLDIPKNKKLRPDSQQVISFISNALEQDSPVAFLNLEHGTVYELESWHWVTIIALEYYEEYQSAVIDILDGGIIKQIDFLQWLHTSKLGGGLVRFQYSTQ